MTSSGHPPAASAASSSTVAAIVLAAGKGTRMKSAMPKVLHAIAGRPILDWVMHALEGAGVTRACAVLSEDLAPFAAFLAARPGLVVATQKNRLGTGDAVASAARAIAGAKVPSYAAGDLVRGQPLGCSHVLIVTGDVPAVEPTVLRAFMDDVLAKKATVGVLGVKTARPYGYGRLVHDAAGKLTAIVEEKDADAATKSIDVINSGLIFAERDALFTLLGELTPANSQREYYLTDIVGHAVKRGLGATAYVTSDASAFEGINDRAQLAQVEALLVARLRRELMHAGATLRLATSTYVEAGVTTGQDVDIGASVSLMGRTRIGSRARIGAGARLTDAEIGEGAVIGDGAVIQRCQIAPGERVPPLSVRLGVER